MGRETTEVRQEQIAEEALNIIAEQGMGCLNMPAVARRVGIVPSALYRHFPSKDEIVIAAIRVLQRALINRLRTAGQRNKSPSATLGEVITGVGDLLPRVIAIPRIVFSLSVKPKDKQRRAVARLLNEALGEFAGLIRQGQELGEFNPGIDPNAAAVFFWGILMSTTARWYISGDEFDAQEYLQKAWNMYLYGISGQARPGSKK